MEVKDTRQIVNMNSPETCLWEREQGIMGEAAKRNEYGSKQVLSLRLNLQTDKLRDLRLADVLRVAKSRIDILEAGIRQIRKPVTAGACVGEDFTPEKS